MIEVHGLPQAFDFRCWVSFPKVLDDVTPCYFEQSNVPQLFEQSVHKHVKSSETCLCMMNLAVLCGPKAGNLHLYETFQIIFHGTLFCQLTQ